MKKFTFTDLEVEFGREMVFTYAILAYSTTNTSKERFCEASEKPSVGLLIAGYEFAC